MALVFTPSTPIAHDDHGVRAAYWYAVWDRPIEVPVDLQPGGTIYLYDNARDVLVWRTTVVDTIAVPFEHVDDFRRHLASRWSEPCTPLADAPVPGFGIAWRAEPDELLLTPRPAGVAPLEEWTVTGHLAPDVASAWGLEADQPCLTCAGRA